MSTFEEVKFAYQLLKNLILEILNYAMHGNYPTTLENANLNVIDQYRKHFKCPIGFSDHTEGSTAAICAVGKGVKIIEKHFTISKKLKARSQNVFGTKRINRLYQVN